MRNVARTSSCSSTRSRSMSRSCSTCTRLGLVVFQPSRHSNAEMLHEVGVGYRPMQRNTCFSFHLTTSDDESRSHSLTMVCTFAWLYMCTTVSFPARIADFRPSAVTEVSSGQVKRRFFVNVRANLRLPRRTSRVLHCIFAAKDDMITAVGLFHRCLPPQTRKSATLVELAGHILLEESDIHRAPAVAKRARRPRPSHMSTHTQRETRQLTKLCGAHPA